MKMKSFFPVLTLFLIGTLNAQMYPGLEELLKETERTSSKTVEFPELPKEKKEEKKTLRETFEDLKRQKEAKLRERLAQPEALEKAVDPRIYVVGPGDVFSLNVWGSLEMQYPLTVNPEGKLLVPSVGEIEVAGKTLEEVQKEVLEKARPFYEKSPITLSLESVRRFRIHVTGEVQFPGTYIVQAGIRIFEAIVEAGGLTESAWRNAIEIRHENGKTDTVDLDFFEQTGQLSSDLYVHGGDVIYVPPLSASPMRVTVEGDYACAGVYSIRPQEALMDFLLRIRALNQHTDLTKIIVERGKGKKKSTRMFPFQANSNTPFHLEHGDRIILPPKYVYVRGAVQRPGAFPFALNLTAKDYAGMAGVMGNFGGIKTYHAFTRKTERGPHVLVGPGDIVDVPELWRLRIQSYLGIVSTLASLVIAAKAVGIVK